MKIENTVTNNFKTRLNSAHMGPNKDGQTVTQINVETCTVHNGWNMVLIPQKVHVGPARMDKLCEWLKRAQCRESHGSNAKRKTLYSNAHSIPYYVIHCEH